MQNSLFDLGNRYASLSKTEDPQERLNTIIDWAIFRSILEHIDAKERKSKAGRKPICRILMFKMLILQRLHGLSDERLQYQVTDRLSFMQFLGVELAGNVPDARTVWAFRESLKEHKLAEVLFERLNQALSEMGIELKSHQIIDATFVPVPIRRNGRDNSLLLDQAGMSPALGHVGLYSPFIVLVYFVAIRAVYRYERRTLSEYTEVSAERYPDVTLRSAVKGYVLAASAIMMAGSWLPFVAKDISDLMGWGQSFVGTLLVAAVTTAPEMVVTISAVRIGALDMAIANLLGSNMFNIIILSVDDLFYTNGPLLKHVDASHVLTAFTAVMMSALVTAGLIFRPQGRTVLGLTWVSLGLFMLYVLNSWILFGHAH